MRICVLENTPNDYEDGPTVDFARYLPQHTYEHLLILKETAHQQIENLAKERKDIDCYINLCDGAEDSETAGIEAIRALELLNLPFTGARSSFFSKTKEEMKYTARRIGIPTANFVFAFKESDILEAAALLKYPIIVKHFNGYSSISITPKSKVHNKEELLEQARILIKDYGGALIEEFIEGREFTVLATENPSDPKNPIILRPIECKFENSETFKHYDLKWKGVIHWISCEDDKLNCVLKEMSAKMFLALEGSGYGRFDWRVDQNGIPCFLEVNPNCGIFYPHGNFGSADFILSFDSMGHSKFLENSLQLALVHRDEASTQLPDSTYSDQQVVVSDVAVQDAVN